MNADSPDPRQRSRNRWMLVALFAIFFGSLAVAGLLRFSGWRPAGMKNRGELLQQPADVRTLTPTLLAGGAYAWNPMARTWRIVVAPPADCDARCVETARDLYVVWEVLGREATRVDILWLCATTPCAPPAAAPALPNLRLLRADPTLRARLPGADQPLPAGTRGLPVYVIDPNGFVILRYPAGSDPGDLRYDLSKLLKLK